MKHRGEVVRARVEASGLSKSKIAQAIGYSRKHIYNFFEDQGLSFEIIEKIGRVINYDFTADFPDMPLPASVRVPASGRLFEGGTAAECFSKYAVLWDKYTALLEEYKEVSDLLRFLQYKAK